MTRSLRVLAGANAYRTLRAEGLRSDLFRLLVGASGGPKWLVLSGLDRALATGWLAGSGREAPLSMLGSSIGAWRLACHAMADPVAALDRFLDAYLAQRYTSKPPPAEVSAVSEGILRQMLGAAGADEILSHRACRLAVVVARSRHLAASETGWVQAAGLVGAALANSVSRRALSGFYERALFADPRDHDRYAGFPSLVRRVHALTHGNLPSAVLASGSIPMVLAGVRDIPGAPGGVYRDGGITDYHFDLSFAPRGGLTLYPHFYSHLTPGWFDKSLGWRRVSAQRLTDAVILCPSREFVQRLPGGRIPDRSDFVEFGDAERERRWRRVVDESIRLGDDFLALVERPDPGDWLEKMDAGT
jgi:hypothetical protein